MDLQTRKLNAIEYLIGLQDEKVFSKIESTILQSQKHGHRKVSLKPFTQEELLKRAEQSNNDYLLGNVKTQEELEKESETW